MNEPIRLQKYLAQCGIASRRKAEELIAAGKVSIDGQVTTEMGVVITPGLQKITCMGKVVEERERFVSYLLNKPKGYVTTLADPQGRPIVTELLKDVDVRLFPVGRLDLDTEGALILTNDGSLAQKIQHPSHETNKTYEALVRGIPDDHDIHHLQVGILLEGKRTSPAKLKMLNRQGANCLMEIIIHEGRKRQVKKMFSHIGHPVLQLKRTAYGKLQLGSLQTGRYRQLNSADLKKIFL
ncbi:MAG: pseudouridine synthase [Desulfobacterales bacterium GWB2_56_26]|nr:MAG: pseudouridine synthase [Desulfobacterales bacterium GWB2_56_26]